MSGARRASDMETLTPPQLAADVQEDTEELRPRVLVAITLLAVVRGKIVVALGPTGAGEGWSLPRRLLRPHESLEAAAQEKAARIAAGRSYHLEQLYTRGDAQAHGGMLEVTYLALTGPEAVRSGPECRWSAVRDLPPLEPGHREVVGAALERLRRQL